MNQMEIVDLYEDNKSSEIWLSQHPPPSKPLPAIPRLRYPSCLHPNVSGSLLSHSIPSPSVSLDENTMYDYSVWSAYSTDYSDAESSSVRTSFDTILEYANNLLPPAPLFQKSAAASTSPVDCRLRREMTDGQATVHTVSPLQQSQAVATLTHGEYEENSVLKACSINRRSSTVFPWSEEVETITSLPSLDLSRSSITTAMEVVCPITPPSQTILKSTQQVTGSTRDQPALRVRTYDELAINDISPPMPSPVGEEVHEDEGFRPSRPAPSIPTPDGGQRSFMLWDDEAEYKHTRVTKMKKSLIDLRNSGRSRSQSVPIQPTRNSANLLNVDMKFELPPTTYNVSGTIPGSRTDRSQQAEPVAKSSQALSWLSKKKSRKWRRATIGYENILGTESAVKARRQSTVSTTRSTPASPLHKSVVATTTTDDPKHTNRRKGFTRLTRWMRKLLKSS